MWHCVINHIRSGHRCERTYSVLIFKIYDRIISIILIGQLLQTLFPWWYQTPVSYDKVVNYKMAI